MKKVFRLHRWKATAVACAAALLCACGVQPGARHSAPGPAPGTTVPAPPTDTKPAADPPAVAAGRPQVGAQAPDISGSDVQTSKNIRLSQFKGQVVYLNFWATWCGPCKDEMPDLQKLQNQYQGKVKVFAVDADGGEDPEAMKAYADNLHLSFSMIWDEGKAGRHYRPLGLPTSLVIDPSGRIVEIHEGQVAYPDMLKMVERATAN